MSSEEVASKMLNKFRLVDKKKDIEKAEPVQIVKKHVQVIEEEDE